MVVAADAVSAGEFGVADGALGFAQDDEGRAAAAGGKADAGSYAQSVAVDVVRLFEHGGLQAFGHGCSLLRETAGQTDQKFIFSTPSNDVVAAQIAAKALGEFPKDGVSSVITEFVVDLGKSVEIEKHKGERRAHALDTIGLLKEGASWPRG